MINDSEFSEVINNTVKSNNKTIKFNTELKEFLKSVNILSKKKNKITTDNITLNDCGVQVKSELNVDALMYYINELKEDSIRDTLLLLVPTIFLGLLKIIIDIINSDNIISIIFSILLILVVIQVLVSLTKSFIGYKLKLLKQLALLEKTTNKDKYCIINELMQSITEGNNKYDIILRSLEENYMIKSSSLELYNFMFNALNEDEKEYNLNYTLLVDGKYSYLYISKSNNSENNNYKVNILNCNEDKFKEEIDNCNKIHRRYISQKENKDCIAVKLDTIRVINESNSKEDFKNVVDNGLNLLICIQNHGITCKIPYTVLVGKQLEKIDMITIKN